jgi:hypothetical protein
MCVGSASGDGARDRLERAGSMGMSSFGRKGVSFGCGLISVGEEAGKVSNSLMTLAETSTKRRRRVGGVVRRRGRRRRPGVVLFGRPNSPSLVLGVTCRCHAPVMVTAVACGTGHQPYWPLRRLEGPHINPQWNSYRQFAL